MLHPGDFVRCFPGYAWEPGHGMVYGRVMSVDARGVLVRWISFASNVEELFFAPEDVEIADATASVITGREKPQ